MGLLPKQSVAVGNGNSSAPSMEKCSAASVTCLDLDRAEGRYLLAGRSDGSLSIFNVRNSLNSYTTTIKPIDRPWKRSSSHSSSISGILWYPFDSGMFFSSALDGKIKVWDANAATVEHEFLITGRQNTNRRVNSITASETTIASINCIAVSPIAARHSTIACASSAGVHLCDLTSGANSHMLIGHQNDVNAVCWSPTNEYLLATGGMDCSIRTWDIRRPGALQVLDVENRNDTFIHKDYISRSDERERKLVKSHNGPICHLQMSENGSRLLSSALDNKINKWDLMTGKNEVVNFEKITHSSLGKRFSWTAGANGQFLFYPNFKSIYMYRVSDGKLIKSLNGHFDNINCVISNLSQADLYSGGKDASILCWEPPIQSTLVYNFMNSSNIAPNLMNDVRLSSSSLDSQDTDNWSSDSD
jgi:DNA excision repair protein ERCC-8